MQGQTEGQGRSQASAQAQGHGSGQGQEKASAGKEGQGAGKAKGQGKEKASAQGQGQAAGKAQGQGKRRPQGGGKTRGDDSPAGGVHSGVRAGDPNSGSADKRGQVDLKISKAFTPAEKAMLRSIGRDIDEALRRIRGGRVEAKLLSDLGMSKAQLAAFVEGYAKRLSTLKTSYDDKSHVPRGSERGAFGLTGDRALRKGESPAPRLSGLKGFEKLSPDRIRKLYESRRDQFSPEYRKHVEAYLRAISERTPEESAE